MDVFVRLALMAAIFIAATLASGAGTGGGALYIPGYIISLRDVHKAVPLSKVTIFGGCLMSVLINVRRRHPKSNAPIINYELAAIMEPFTLLGAIIGVLLNIVMTDFQILACLVLTLSFTSYKTFKKGLAQRAEETRILKELEGKGEQDDTENDFGRLHRGHLGSTAETRAELQQLLPAEDDTPGQLPLKRLANTQDTTYFTTSCRLFDIQEGSAVVPAALAEFEKDFYCGTCQVSFLYLVVDSLLNVVLLILAGGPVAVLCGSQWQQGCIYLLFSVHVLGTFLFARWLIRRRQRLEAAGCSNKDIQDGGLQWLTPITAFVYPLLSMAAGVLAGAIGIGGGLVKGPLLLEIGLPPLAAVSTANFMIFFTSSANTLQYAILGRLGLVDSICFFLTAFVAGAVGIGCVFHFMKTTHRQSYLTFLLSFVTLISLCCMVGSFVHTHYFMYEVPMKLLTLNDACEQQQHAGRLLFSHL
ncbi:hypothetical protein, conserved [Eimeria necatrix]|uniref:Sulfite exporter TauE/SafE n=1 Tax=Eimeria necatrix TaxID=51315 RepID=U6MKB6_9EIME|nr:hypothetical protein, conserved [Eimeria necatrix]CDJ64677.1 hypothetical protein, conserved [Eimeria necatrix]